MKTLVIIAGVLAVMTVVNGLNVEKLRNFYQQYAKCDEELGGTSVELHPEKIHCALVKLGKIVKANGEFDKEETLKSIEETITDANKLKQAKMLFHKCYNETIQGGSTGKEQTMKIVTCASAIVDLLDKLN
ncbi:PREDICTED: uncharacterized protein LOC106747250 [Dinoponera quadriceps]|uniref:Uncharacterized protein LOC106747250 n=1 Tax=Dinoponera quadriceps TaxID=609295 RepID=A0A6P3XPZ6_DINQU|nr:PREDICTED: uncharacterized protein LOC106747250 [Dinoponera quadriceps]